MKSNVNRRKFLGYAASTAAFTIVPRHVLGGPRGRPQREDHHGPDRLRHPGVDGDDGHARDAGSPDRRRLRPEQGQRGLRRVGQRQRAERSPTGWASRTGGRGSRAVPAAATSGKRWSSCTTRAKARRRVQGMCRVRRFPRAARKGEGRRRGQGHDAGSSPRDRRDRGHEEGQARPDAQAAGQSACRRPGWSSRPRARRRSPRISCRPAPGEQVRMAARLDQGRRDRHAARDPQLVEPAGLAAVRDDPDGHAAGAEGLRLGPVARAVAAAPLSSALHARGVPRLVRVRRRAGGRHGPLQPLAGVPANSIWMPRSRWNPRRATSARSSTT